MSGSTSAGEAAALPFLADALVADIALIAAVLEALPAATSAADAALTDRAGMAARATIFPVAQQRFAAAGAAGFERLAATILGAGAARKS